MLIPISPSQVSKLIPSVATASQFKFALGDPRKILQRLIISVIGGVINFLLSGQLYGSQTSSFWLVLSVLFFLYMLWGPILEASRKNAKFKKYEFFSVFDGYIAEIYRTERIESSREQSNREGKLELIENKRTWLVLELEDDDGYLGKLSFPMENKHALLRTGLTIRCIVTSNNKNFGKNILLTDAWLPQINLWVGDYPYLLRPAFQEICYIYKNKFSL